MLGIQRLNSFSLVHVYIIIALSIKCCVCVPTLVTTLDGVNGNVRKLLVRQCSRK